MWSVWKQVYIIETSLKVGHRIQNDLTDLKDKHRPEAPRVASTDGIPPKKPDIIFNDGSLTI